MIKAILTGHTRGLGAALRDELLARGIAVLGLARQRAAEQPQLQQHLIDLGDSATLATWLAGPALANFLADATQALLINNAGTLQPMGPAGMQDNAALARAIALNVAAPLLLTNSFIAASGHLADRRILHISSGAARNAYPGWNAYCAGKAALDRHAEALKLEAAPGLRIASLAPGVIDTDMQAEIRASDATAFPLRDRFVALKAGGQLSSPTSAAKSAVDHLLSANFGEKVLVDVRELGGTGEALP